ncbi:MAG: proline--tRNA ligase [Flavobacteriales bacterium]|nr:proline--tRNA ligase [Flavobacteriales bacterium]|tara:strand:+ start:748 stop:2217 length:1470 start_codon:yes stop_codon:yes gene_type:complete
MSNKITSRSENFSKWYNDIIINADLAENSGVRGCMVIKPYGFAIWEEMKSLLDQMFKETGHVNAYFPIFIPKSFFSKEASHVDGFAKECAVVTHYRLKNDIDGNIIVDEEAKLEEELIVRPTSETIIWDTYKKWIKSYRDLPLLINQWANVVRWEMRTRLFLRTSEFLWQEGHTAHENKDQAIEETRKILAIYKDFIENNLAIPVVDGLKSSREKFAGAIDTYCVEALMQDGKALQAGTSHFLGQNFAKAFDVKFANRDGKLDYVWASSWGVSTRLIGALVMTHSDDRGLVLPPKLAPFQVVLVPIYHNEREYQELVSAMKKIAIQLRGLNIRVKTDFRDTHKPGWKFAEYEMKGVPIRIAMGPRDLANKTFELVRRDNLEKRTIEIDVIQDVIPNILAEMQSNLFSKANDFKKKNTFKVDDFDDFKAKIDNGGFVLAHWDGTPETEDEIKKITKATIRCIPIDSNHEKGECILTKKPSLKRVFFAKSY